MTKQVVCSAPGKVIITGEHSVVYGEPALLASLDYRCKAKIRRLKASEVRLYSNRLQGVKKEKTDKVRTYWFKAKETWEEFNRSGEAQGLRSVGKDKFLVMLCSVGLCLEEFSDFGGGLEIKLESQLPIISGFGSSAYVSASIIGGISEFVNKKYSKGELFKRVYEIEKIIHGRPSGGDPTIVINGGFIEFQKKDEKFSFKPLKIKKEKVPEIFLINSGKASESTGEMVTLVREKLNSNKKKFGKIIKQMGKLSVKFMNLLGRDVFEKNLIRENERYLEELSVVGNKARMMVELIEGVGGVAKISGGGGIKKGSGVVIAYHDDREKLIDLIKREKWQFFPTKLGGEGWKIE